MDFTNVLRKIKQMTPSGMKNHVEEAQNKSMKNHLLDLPYKGERRNTYCSFDEKVCQQNSTRKC